MKTASRILGILGIAFSFLCTAVVAQRNSTVPQPQAGRLSAVSPARPNRGALVEKPASVIPDAPEGFTVSAYAEMDRAPHDGVRAERRSLRQLARREHHHRAA